MIAPIDSDDLAPDTAAAISRARRSGALSSTVLPRIWAHRPELADAQITLQSRFYDSAILPGRLLELVRLRIASINQCQVCQTARKSVDVSEEDIACLSDDDGRFSASEQAALKFATALAADHLSIGGDEIESLLEHFSSEQAVELGMFAALMVGSGRLAYAFRALEAQQ
ncbi:hypothetical protein MDUV_19450 [Mycolicibacterium duvalii]|uniref:Carboxymuconolactone decarboxylase n=1 Tax=Mycolicibacterium duvalii TaxID=39688 RepID=A0A7I7JZ07_9MYCO|nr:hypothetical protein MDUV_19450 [Mycolicibacterium duvalii]